MNRKSEPEDAARESPWRELDRFATWALLVGAMLWAGWRLHFGLFFDDKPTLIAAVLAAVYAALVPAGTIGSAAFAARFRSITTYYVVCLTTFGLMGRAVAHFWLR